MDWQRSALLAAIAVVAFTLFIQWNKFNEAQVPEQDTTTLEAGGSVQTIPDRVSGIDAQLESDIPQPVVLEESGAGGQSASHLPPEPTGQLITVKTDVLQVMIDTLGGDIVKVALLEHRTGLEEDAKPFILLNRTSTTTYIAQSGLIGNDGTDTSKGRPIFAVVGTDFELGDRDQLTVDLVTWQDRVKITKRFVFHRADYLVDLKYLIDNQGSGVWQAGFFAQLKRDSQQPQQASKQGVQAFLGAALTTNEDHYKKLKFKDIEKSPFRVSLPGGWIAMVQHYFIGAWIGDTSTTNQYNLRKLGGQDLYALGYTSPQIQVAPGEQGVFNAGFYAGPKNQKRLEEIAPYLDLTVDYGWLWWLAKPIFSFLHWIHSLVGNWGWSIILLTVTIKALFFHLSATSYRSMARMRKLQPEMTRLRDLYGDDKPKLSQEMMALYKREKVNPMGGCLPILVQMPVFLSLYWVLLETVELRHSPWIFWIQDLSTKDPYFILPLVMGASMWIQQTLNPAPPDPTQAKVMKIMPVAFTFFFLWFPAGLVLYWLTNNILSIAQQLVITRNIEASEKR